MTLSTVPATVPMTSAPPPAGAFPDWPMGWYVLAPSRELSESPVSVDLFGRRIVGFRTSDGTPVAMDARCWHMGADLSFGRVVGNCIECPFHGWRFAADGRCTTIPSRGEAPSDARQRTFATAERAGFTFVYPAAEPGYPAPFFAGVKPANLLAAPPFEFEIDCPWWIVGTNGFDTQHFAVAHDRRLVGAPAVTEPHPAARRILATFEVVGDNLRDALTRRFAGRHVTMDVTVWSGTLAFVMARFHDNATDSQPLRTVSYGMTEIVPQPPGRSRVRITIFTRRRRGLLQMLDPLDVRVRRRFIRAFLEPDVRLLDGVHYRPERLNPTHDRVMIDYLRWLAPVSRCRGQLTMEQP